MSNRALVTAFTFLLATPFVLQAQDASKPRPDSSAAAGMDHHMGPWKEMNAFHKVLGATWHPASQKKDLVPLRVRAGELRIAAEAWAASKAPESHATCGSEEVKNAIAKVAKDTRGIAAMIIAGADDAWLAASLKGVHDTFEVAEKACGGHGA